MIDASRNMINISRKKRRRWQTLTTFILYALASPTRVEHHCGIDPNRVHGLRLGIVRPTPLEVVQLSYCACCNVSVRNIEIAGFNKAEIDEMLRVQSVEPIPVILPERELVRAIDLDGQLTTSAAPYTTAAKIPCEAQRA